MPVHYASTIGLYVNVPEYYINTAGFKGRNEI